MEKNLISLKTKDGEVNLMKSTLTQLKDLLDRQKRLLNNRIFIEKLPDKGSRIQAFHDKILEEINKRDQVDEASELLSKISLSNLPNDLEWKKTESQTSSAFADEIDDLNPLKILATHSGTQRSKTKNEESTTPSLVTEKDIAEAKSFKTGTYAGKLCEKYDKKTPQERFKLNVPKQTELAKTGFRSSCENVKKSLGKHWEVTAATPPVPVHDRVERISLADSLAIQLEQARKLKEIKLKEATERLQASSSLSFGSSLPKSDLMAYRTPVDPVRLFEGTPVREGPIDENELADDPETGSFVLYNCTEPIIDT